MESSENRPLSDPADDSELDAEGEEVDDDFEQPIVVASPENRRLKRPLIADEEATPQDSEDEDEASSANEAVSNGTTSESEEEEWEQEESAGEEETDSRGPDSNLCMSVLPSFIGELCTYIV